MFDVVIIARRGGSADLAVGTADIRSAMGKGSCDARNQGTQESYM